MSAISEKYASLGGAGGFLGAPATPEFPTPGWTGAFQHYEHGSIYWSEATGAHEVHGPIRDLWADLGWELSPLGFPKSDEVDAPMHVARVSYFEHGAIYWDQGRGAYEVYDRPALAIPDPAAGGQWELAPFDSAAVSMPLALLEGERIVSLGYLEPIDHNHPGHIPSDHGESAVVDLNTGAATVPHYMGPFHMLPNIFCSGHALMADGRWLIAGGDREEQERVRALHVYEPEPDGPGHWRHLGLLAQGRWYPTCVTLPDGRVLIVGGEKRLEVHNQNTTFELFDPHTELLSNELDQPSMLLPFITYPFVYVLPDRTVVSHVGVTTTRYTLPDLAFDGTVLDAIDRPNRQVRTFPWQGTSVLLPLLPDADPPYHARILAIGGGGPDLLIRTDATASCEILDLAATPLAWKPAPSLHHARVMPDSVLLPDGTVLVTSGSAKGSADNSANPVWQAELYDPVTNTWTEMASTSVPRLYHSTALLLPDGRVMTAGSDSLWNPEPFHHPERRIELFSPPYLFAGPRPVIAHAPAAIRPGGDPFVVETPDAATIDAVALMRVGSSTHSFNSDQRHVGLQILGHDGHALTLAPPPDGYVAPPGPYLLFILRDGVPSVAAYVTVELTGAQDRRAPVLGASRADEHLDVFVTGRDGQVRTAAWEPSFGIPWHGWWDLPDNVSFPDGAPVHAVSRSADHLDVFAVDDTGTVVTTAWSPTSGGWAPWTPLPGVQVPPGAPVTVESHSPDRLDTFVVAADGTVKTTGWQPGATWSPWQTVGTRQFPPGTAIGVVSRSPGKLDIFGVDVAGETVTAAWEPELGPGDWAGWWHLAFGHATPGAPISAVSRSADKLDIFLTSPDGTVMTTGWEPDFTGWKPWKAVQPGRTFVPAALVSAISRNTDHLDIVAVDIDGIVAIAAWEPAFAPDWRGWWDVDGARAAPGSTATVLSRSADMLDVVWVSASDGQVATSGWGPGRGPDWTPWQPIG